VSRAARASSFADAPREGAPARPGGVIEIDAQAMSVGRMVNAP